MFAIFTDTQLQSYIEILKWPQSLGDFFKKLKPLTYTAPIHHAPLHHAPAYGPKHHAPNPIYTFVKTDPHANFKWGVKHLAGVQYGKWYITEEEESLKYNKLLPLETIKSMIKSAHFY